MNLLALLYLHIIPLSLFFTLAAFMIYLYLTLRVPFIKTLIKHSVWKRGDTLLIVATDTGRWELRRAWEEEGYLEDEKGCIWLYPRPLAEDEVKDVSKEALNQLNSLALARHIIPRLGSLFIGYIGKAVALPPALAAQLQAVRNGGEAEAGVLLTPEEAKLWLDRAVTQGRLSELSYHSEMMGRISTGFGSKLVKTGITVGTIMAAAVAFYIVMMALKGGGFPFLR